MNLKKAKALRRLAADVHRALTNPLESTQYRQHIKNGNIIVDPMSPRGVYRRVKKEFV